jgi:hypothetical protein
MHYRNSTTVGAQLGANVVTNMLQRAFLPRKGNLDDDGDGYEGAGCRASTVSGGDRSSSADAERGPR